MPAVATTTNTLSKPASRNAAWIGGNMPTARFGLILNLWIPFLFLLWDAMHGNLGADPVNDALLTTGLVAITYLLLSLAVTPLRMATNWTWLVQFRRSLGVYAFYYACAHLAIYFWWDRGHNLHSTVYEITHRYYLTIGFISLVLMAPLWATSLNVAIRLMGATWWKRLHRLAYVAAGLGCWHLYLQSKADKRRPDVYFAILGALLLWRVVAVVMKRWRTQAVAVSAASVQPARASFWKGELKVVGMFPETESVRTFRFASADGGRIPFDFRAGQFLNLMLEIDSKRVSRSYTIASPPTRDHYVELTVKREANGHVSRFLHDMLMTGHAVAISAPAGRFTFDATSSDSVLFLAGGVGITPAMSMIRDLTDRSWPGKIDLVFSVRSPGDVIFGEELRYLARRHANLHVHITATRDVGPEWTGLQGRISAELLRRCVPDVVSRPAFICGPDAMAMAARDELVALGVPTERIHVESFTPAAAVAKDDGIRPTSEMANGAAATITFSRSGRSVPVPAGRTVLDAAEAAGISIDYQCRSGICGTCRCKLLSGHVTMAVRDALSDSDEAAGYILACQALPVEDVTVEA
jgi:ferredoxin-NADP reductase/DMSO/TMAO reductase YedYZ heme-binding membrane subunit